MAYVILPGQESLAHMEAVWRRLVFHFFGALVILLTGFLSGLRANAVSFCFFRFWIPYFSKDICRSPSDASSKVLKCPLHGILLHPHLSSQMPTRSRAFGQISFQSTFLETARTSFVIPIKSSVVNRIRLQNFRCAKSQVNAAT